MDFLARVLRRIRRLFARSRPSAPDDGELDELVRRARRAWTASLGLEGRVLELTGAPRIPAGATYDAILVDRSLECLEIGELRDVLGDIRNHLRPGGRFVLDTVNRSLTGAADGAVLGHRDHPYEFDPHEMDEILLRHGFRVTRRAGLVPMPRSSLTGEFDPTEIDPARLVSADVESCLVFAYECVPWVEDAS